MALSINTNVASLNAQRNLQQSQESLNTSLQRLSTGLRINSAKDDAAGLAISTRFTTQINGLNQAVRNANDGISLAQTGEAALDEITNNLQRIRELAVQSANATNSSSDREAIDAEVTQRLAEINRIGTQTSFNGTKLLDGSFGNAAFQVGANVGETIDVNLATGMKASQIGSIASGTGQLTGTAFSGLTVKVGDIDAVSIADPEDAVAELGTGYEANSAFAAKTAMDNAGVEGLYVIASTTATDTLADAGGASGDTYGLSINGVVIYAANTDASTAISAENIVSAINGKNGESGVSATFDGTNVTLTADDGRNITATETLVGMSTAFGGSDIASGAEINGTVTLSATESITFTGTQSALGFAGTSLAASGSLSTASVLTADDSNTTIQRIDSALESVSTLRSGFGAVQNRFESTITNLQTISENLSASRGRILDADFAAETANLTKAQILQQAGTAILAQANALPQAALSLLQ
ncbi:MAG: flagellin [Zhongshania sp.]|jgi:flagellin